MGEMEKANLLIEKKKHMNLMLRFIVVSVVTDQHLKISKALGKNSVLLSRAI